MKGSENLYTFLFEYKDQKYISQTVASNPHDAILPWANGLDYHKNFDFYSGKNKGVVYCIKTEAN